MDRMLVAQALNADMTIITVDRLFESYGVRTVW
jgi:PIN domain nuclease of toxin-antitoxin system